MMLNAMPDPRLAHCTPTRSCVERIPSAHVIDLLYPNQAFDKRQLTSGLINFYQHRDRFMHRRTLTPVPKRHSISIDPWQITASA